MKWFTPTNARAERVRYSKEETGGIPPEVPDEHMRELTLRCGECGDKLHVVALMTDRDEENVRFEWDRIHN